MFFPNLQSSRQQLSELQLENSTLKAEAMNRSHKEKGNSLFGEVPVLTIYKHDVWFLLFSETMNM
jgi:hypothetical protein